MEHAALYALALIFAAALLFKLSTVQAPWPARVAIWALGAAAVLWAAALAFKDPESYGVWRAVAEVLSNWAAPEDSLVWRAVAQNWRTLPNFLAPLTDFALFIAVLLGLLCLLALTPGERLERAARTALVGVMGVIVGGVLSIAVVALGFGGEAHRAVLVGIVADEAVLDGDTLQIGSTSIRLWGVDAPELGQTCIGDVRCGELARVALFRLVAGHMVECHARTTRTGNRVESFGRPLMQCFVGAGPRTDLAKALILEGVAVPYRDREGQIADYAPLDGGFALGCTLHPGEWRRNREARRAFEADGVVLGGVGLIGDCSRRGAQ